MSNLYDNPKYYEIAFSFRDIPAEVDVFEKSFKRFSEIPVKSVLELACGNSPHMKELVKRGYQYNGLDLS
ncbi:class I SAM-dependent methyltransferase, partial [candidate division WOR-3 bacterium]|nr:class I SAM-dependent methyltransferase [candidate division WOR-3 bacterium]